MFKLCNVYEYFKEHLLCITEYFTTESSNFYTLIHLIIKFG